jgi:hypothetical protein
VICADPPSEKPIVIELVSAIGWVLLHELPGVQVAPAAWSPTVTTPEPDLEVGVADTEVSGPGIRGKSKSLRSML